MNRSLLIYVLLGACAVNAAEAPILRPPADANPSLEDEATDWVTTRSEPGRFSVRLPFAANVVAFDEPDQTKDLQHMFGVGGAIDPDIRFLATRAVYRGGRDMAAKYFQSAATSACDGCTLLVSTPVVVGQYKGFDTEQSMPEVTLLTRALLVDSDLITLILIARSSRLDDARRQAEKFFASITIDPR